MTGERKIRLLGITNGNTSGVAYFRLQIPLNYLDTHSDKFELLCLAAEEVDITAKNLDNVDIVHFHANICSNKPLMDKLLDMQKRGCKLVMDLDDYFEIPKTNPFHKAYNETLQKPIVFYMGKVNYLTTTTKLYAKELKKYNKKVMVFPNVLDKSIKQFNQPITTPTKKLRIGLLCGSSHQYDIELLDNLIDQLKDYHDRIQFVLCGFSVSEIPEASVWNVFEQIMTDNYSILDDDYKRYLLTYNKDVEYPDENKQYIRRWTKDVHTYGELYNDLDVLLAPLLNNKFNCMKSELKVTEAGNFGKVFLGSSVGIYKEVITDGFNGLLVHPFQNDYGWATQIKRLLDEPGLYDFLQSNIYNLNVTRYNISKWNDKRISFYEQLITK